ncbi:MAG: hypothetical protein EP303_05935 [Deltaproteobacteria bacterium]|nr:MAG: hypothetical protein EP303_05935 [Deltaproteobacteria bacterium]
MKRLGAALRAREPDAILGRCDELMQCDIEPAEQATLAFTQYDVTQNIAGAHQEAQLLLRSRIGDPNSHAWAPHVARAHAAWVGNTSLLAEAHEAIAGLTSGDTQLGHLCAAGQEPRLERSRAYPSAGLRRGPRRPVHRFVARWRPA